MLNLLELARLEEARVATGVAAVSDLAEPFAGGLMCYAGPHAWASEAKGVGLDGPVEDEAVDAFVEFYTSRGVAPCAEVTPFADPSLLKALAARGFTLQGFDAYLAVDLRESGPIAAPASGLDIRVLDPSNEADVLSFLDLEAAGFPSKHRDVDDRLMRRVVNCDLCTTLLASIDGVDVGASGVEIQGRISSFIAGTTHPDFRGRGVQTAMMLARMQIARDAGCDFIGCGGDPTVATVRNALRLGFTHAYTKVTLKRQGDG